MGLRWQWLEGGRVCGGGGCCEVEHAFPFIFIGVDQGIRQVILVNPAHALFA